MNETIRIIENRASLRRFAQKAITKEHKDILFNCAMRAPTAGNQMLYSMIDVTDQQKKELLAVSCDNQPFIATAPMVVIFLADHTRWFDFYQKNDVKSFCDKNEEFSFEAPQESDLLLAIEDAMIAAQNMVIAAESLNIGSCYIGDIVENYESIKDEFNLPDWAFPIGMLVLGYYPENHKKVLRSRFAKEYIVFENSYKQLSDNEVDEMFAEQSKKYQQNNKYNAENYAQQFYARKTGAAFSKEMARSVRVALKKWDGRKL